MGTHISVPVMLMPDDFKAYTKIKVDNHAFNKENMPSHFKVKEYCPLVFRNLRERFGIDDASYVKSLTRPPRPANSPGKSGAKFYNSYDELYVIKTLTSEEIEQMHSLLKQYHPFVVERHGKTLLPQYLGMYRLTVDNVEHYLVVMRNVFSNHLKIHMKYDLKGSTIDREASQKERERDHPTFKDNDFLKDGVKIHIGEEAKAKLMETLKADVNFLSNLHVMDYSLLLGVHDIDLAANGAVIDPEKDIYAIPSRTTSQKREIYFLALVDILTQYGVKKQAAKVAKTVKYGSSVDGISTVEPEQYATRFLEFISNAIE